MRALILISIFLISCKTSETGLPPEAVYRECDKFCKKTTDTECAAVSRKTLLSSLVDDNLTITKEFVTEEYEFMCKQPAGVRYGRSGIR